MDITNELNQYITEIENIQKMFAQITVYMEVDTSAITEAISKVQNEISEAAKPGGEDIASLILSAFSTLPTVFEAMKKVYYPDAFEEARKIGEQMGAGLINGLKEKNITIKRTVSDLAGNVIGEFQETLKIQSPSKVFKQLGEYITEGLVDGIKEGSDDVTDTMRGLGDDMESSFGEKDFSFGGLGAAFGVITAIGGAFTALMSTNEEFGAAVDAVWTQITEAFAPVTEAVTSLIVSFGEEGMGGAFSWFSDALTGVYLLVFLNLFSTKAKRSFIPYAAKL